MTEDDNGSGQDEARQAQMRQVADFLYLQLSAFCPDISDKHLRRSAFSIAQTTHKAGEMLERCIGTEDDNEAPVWFVDLVKEKQIQLVGADNTKEGLRVVGHKDLASCDDVDEVLRSATVLALLTSPLARALLMAHGYGLRFGEGGYAPRDTDRDNG